MSGLYIGITGVVTDEDVETVRLCAALVPRNRVLMAGVLVSAKTLRGERVASRRYPAFETARKLLRELAQFAWPVVHFNTRADATLLDQMLVVTDQLPHARGIQLNIASPDPAAVEEFARRRKHLQVVLQLNRASVGAGETADVGAFLQRYPSASHALLDASGGTGRELDTDRVAAALRGWQSHATPGIAGGLGPHCEPQLRRVAASAPGVQFSVDAESAVREPVADPTPGEKHQDQLNRSAAIGYMRAVAAALAP